MPAMSEKCHALAQAEASRTRISPVREAGAGREAGRDSRSGGWQGLLGRLVGRPRRGEKMETIKVLRVAFVLVAV